MTGADSSLVTRGSSAALTQTPGRSTGCLGSEVPIAPRFTTATPSARLNNIDHWPAGNTCNIKFAARSIRTEEEVARMRELVTTFMSLGGQQLQINVVDGATLREAQANPDAYQHLIVRVAGSSAYFTRLGRDVQDEIISRTVFTP